MLVNIGSVPFRTRNPNLVDGAYDGDDLNMDFVAMRGWSAEQKAHFRWFYYPEPIETGIYPTTHLRDAICGIQVSYSDGQQVAGRDSAGATHLDPWGMSREDALLAIRERRGIDSYGIADNLEQVKAHLKPFIDDPDRQYVIGVDFYGPEDKAGSGWRWHKEGTYIGVHDPQCEYFRDEPEIDSVIMFHVYEVRLPDNMAAASSAAAFA